MDESSTSQIKSIKYEKLDGSTAYFQDPVYFIADGNVIILVEETLFKVCLAIVLCFNGSHSMDTYNRFTDPL